MNEPFNVLRARCAVSFVVGVSFALTACGGTVTAPTAVTSTAAGTEFGIETAAAKHKPGVYPYLGCLADFQPPVCIPATLTVHANGEWSLQSPVQYATPDHPDWVFDVYDLWFWESHDQKCTGGGDPSHLYDPGRCVSQTRHVRTMTFETWVFPILIPQGPTLSRERVHWTYAARPVNAGPHP